MRLECFLENAAVTVLYQIAILIDNGATVNDQGGKHCEGVTHDASSCVHIDVDTLLT